MELVEPDTVPSPCDHTIGTAPHDSCLGVVLQSFEFTDPVIEFDFCPKCGEKL